MNIMKKLLSVFVVLAMLLTFVACDSSSKKNDDDDDEDESEETVELNNDFEGTYEGEIELGKVYCYALDVDSDAEEYANDLDDYLVTAIFDIKEDTLNISFDYKKKDVKNFVNDFYTAVAEDMFEEDEVEEKLEEAEDQIDLDIDTLEDYLTTTANDIDYEFDEESVLELTFDDETVEFEIDWGKKKFTVEDFDVSDPDLEGFAEIFEDVTFKKVANYEEDNKKDDESEDESKDEPKDESKNENSNTAVPDVSFAPVPDVSDIESSEPDVDVPVEADSITGTYKGTINLLDAYYIMSEYEASVYDAELYMTNSYYLDVTVQITDNTISLDIIEDYALIDAFVDEFAYAYVKSAFANLSDAEIQSYVDSISSEIAQDKADLKAEIVEVYLYNLSYTYDDSTEVIAVDVFGNTMNISIIVDDYNGNFEIYSIYDDEYNNSTELETLFYYTVFEKQ